MKLKLYLQDPDGVSTSIEDYAQASVDKIDGLSDEEKADLYAKRVEATNEALSPWTDDGESFTVEVDTDLGIAVLTKRGA